MLATLICADALRRSPLTDDGAKLTMPTLLMATAALVPAPSGIVVTGS